MIYDDYLRFQKQLEAIETQPESIKIIINEFPLWFLIKDSLDYFLFTRFATSGVSLIKRVKGIFPFVIKGMFSELKFFIKKKELENKSSQQRFLFIFNNNFRYKDGKGIWVDPFWSEIIKKLKNEYDIYIIEYNHGEKGFKRKEESVLFPEYYIKNPLYNINYYFNRKRTGKILNELNEFDKLMFQFYKKNIIEKELYILINQFLTSKYIRFKINSFLNEYKKALKLLSVIKPQLIFITSLQGHHGIIAAANFLNIKVVEYQHGIIDPNHPAYNYSKLIKEKKGEGILVPDYLFLFGEYWKKLLLKGEFWDEDQLYITGNSKYKNLPYYPSIYKKEDVRRFQILFTANDIFREEANEYFDKFLSLVGKNKMDVQLHIKLHPRETHTAKYYQHLLKKYGNICRLRSEKISIHDIFINMDYHITSYSATIYESIEAGIPSATIHPFGLHYFKDLISEGAINQFMDPYHFFDHIKELIYQKGKLLSLIEKTGQFKGYFFGRYDINTNVNYIKDIASRNVTPVPA